MSPYCKSVSELFNSSGYQKDLRVRSDADVVCTETTVEAAETLLLSNLGEAVHHAAVGKFAVGSLGLLLESCLDKVEGQREERGEETSNCTGSESLGAGREVGVVLKLDLRFTEESELTKVESHSSCDCGSSTGPESRDTFALGDAGESINDGLVVFSLSQGLEAVTLHSDESQISRVTNHGSDTTG